MEIEKFNQALDYKMQAHEALEEIAFENLTVVASQYIKIYGEESGLCELAEDLCTKVAPEIDTQAWHRIIHRIKVISG